MQGRLTFLLETRSVRCHRKGRFNSYVDNLLLQILTFLTWEDIYFNNNNTKL